MERQEIHFEVAPDGAVKFTVKGVQGQGCSEVAEALKGLGRVVSVQKTREYYRTGTSSLRVRTHGSD
jgi:hypothetical protein